MIRNPWPAFLGRWALAIAVGVLLTWITGAGWAVAALFFGAALAWNLSQLARLERWLRLDRRVEPPLSSGVWGEVFHAVSRRQRRQRERLQRLRGVIREYRDSAKAMPDATVVLYRGDHILWWNDAARRLLGLRWPDDEGQRITNLIRAPQLVEQISAQGRGHDPLILPSPGVARCQLELRSVPYGRDQQLLIARDVTRTQRLETIRRDFIANVSHELKTPLTVIIGVAEQLNDELAPCEPQWAPAVSLLSDQARRMHALVDDLLALSRLETAPLATAQQAVDVGALLERVCGEARALSRDAQHQIELDAEAGLHLFGAEGELRSAFSNLLSNAVRYSPEGGGIRVRWWSDSAGAYVRVEDSGIGIPSEHIPRLTERFYRVDSGRSNVTGGTGLGLAIVKHVAHRHGGRLEIASVPGEGSVFTLVFPLQRTGFGALT